MKNNIEIVIPGIPLTVILIILKVVGLSGLSWLWTLCPLWLPIAFFVIMAAGVAGFLMFAAIGIWFVERKKSKRRKSN